MAEYGSDHYVQVNRTTGVSTEALRTQRSSALHLAPTRGSSGPVQMKRAECILPTAIILADNEVLAMMDFKSNDRIWEIYAYNNGGFTATQQVNIGLYHAGEQSVGDEIDEDLYAVDLNYGGALARADVFEQSNVLDEYARGLTLWEQAAIGLQTWEEDPGGDFTLACTMASLETVTAAVAIAVLEVWYVPGR